MSEKARIVFGLIAYALTAFVIWFVLSDHVPPEKETMANIILGSALTWPGIPLAFYFGSSSGSKEKSAMLNGKSDDGHEQV